MGTKQFDNYADLITFTRASGATYLDSDGVLKTASTNIPRIEYDADGNRLGLLVEEQRTNLLTYSSEFDNAAWTANNTTVTANDTTAPDGTSTAEKITDDASDDQHNIRYAVTTISGSTYAYSIYVKADTHNFVFLYCLDNSVVNYHFGAIFDLSTAVVSQTSSSNATLASSNITSVGNSWYRIEIVGNLTGRAINSVRVGFSPAASGVTIGSAGQITYSGTGTSFYIWGAQLEAASFPTSYIPTSGSTATRAADVASIPTSAFGYNNKEVTVMVEFIAPNWTSSSNFNRVLSVDGKWSIFNNGAVGGDVRYRFDNDSNVAQFGAANLVGSTYGTTENMSKVAFALKNNDAAITKDGNTVVTDDSGDYDIELRTTFNIGAESASSNFLNGHIKRLTYYPRRLSNAQLVELTQ